jgi:hypothetical protein
VGTGTGAGTGSKSRVVAWLGCRDFHFHLILLGKNIPARTMHTRRVLIRLSAARLVNRDVRAKKIDQQRWSISGIECKDGKGCVHALAFSILTSSISPSTSQLAPSREIGRLGSDTVDGT